jgi:hypothetical protein
MGSAKRDTMATSISVEAFSAQELKPLFYLLPVRHD